MDSDPDIPDDQDVYDMLTEDDPPNKVNITVEIPPGVIQDNCIRAFVQVVPPDTSPLEFPKGFEYYDVDITDPPDEDEDYGDYPSYDEPNEGSQTYYSSGEDQEVFYDEPDEGSQSYYSSGEDQEEFYDEPDEGSHDSDSPDEGYGYDDDSASYSD